jgi:hypothetical protein
MYGNITEQLLKDISSCVAFSLQLDESTDIRDTVQLLVFIRMVFEFFLGSRDLIIFSISLVAVQSKIIFGYGFLKALYKYSLQLISFVSSLLLILETILSTIDKNWL